MSLRNTYLEEQLFVPAFLGPTDVLALTITAEMCVFICSNKNEISFAFLLKALLHFE